VETYLGKHGFDVQTAQDGTEMRTILDSKSFDLFVLDIGLPGESGLEIAKYLRERYANSIGIIMLTASGEVGDRITGLEVGADDYLPKPYEPRELLARIKSILRRYESLESQPGAAEPEERRQLPIGRYTLDLDAHQLLDEGHDPVPITTMEFDLLKAFGEHPDKALSRDTLLNLAHNRDWDPYDRSIDIRITRLRQKIEDNPSKPQIITTVRGIGYMLSSGKKQT